MHELSIAMSIIDIAAEEAERRGGAEVKTVYIRLGPLSGVVKEALVSAYDLAREQTPLAETDLIIEQMPIRVFCAACQAESQIESLQAIQCPRCSGGVRDIIGGRELEVTALEIEQ